MYHNYRPIQIIPTFDEVLEAIVQASPLQTLSTH